MRKSRNTRRKSMRKSRNINNTISRIYGLNDKHTQYLYENKENVKKYKKTKKDMIKWFKGKVKCDDFRDEVFDFSALSGVREANAVMKDAFDCIDDLIDKVVFKICDGYINYSKLVAVICACFGIALKLLSGPDWVYDRELMRELYKICISHDDENDNKRCISNILKMESDILRRTGWKPCKNIF